MSESWSEAERQLLITAYELGKRQRPATDERLAKMGAGLFEETLVDWDGASDSLVGKGMLERDEEALRLTADGWRIAENSTKNFSAVSSRRLWCAVSRAKPTASSARLSTAEICANTA